MFIVCYLWWSIVVLTSRQLVKPLWEWDAMEVMAYFRDWKHADGLKFSAFGNLVDGQLLYRMVKTGSPHACLLYTKKDG